MSSSDTGSENAGAPRWRLFLAAALSDSVRSRLGEAIAELRVLAPLVSPSRLEAIHLTLHFLGPVESTRVGDLSDGLNRSIAPFTAFELLVSSVGAFPAPASPRVLWAGVEGSGHAELIAMYAATASPIRSAGIQVGARAYSPHLTLGRIRREPRASEKASIGEWMHRWRDFQFGTQTVGAIHLMRSDLSARPPRYTTLKTFALQ